MNFVYGSCSLKVDGLHDAFFKHNSNHALHNMTMLNAGLTMYLLSILDEMSHMGSFNNSGGSNFIQF
jgi:hypothetical protein